MMAIAGINQGPVILSQSEREKAAGRPRIEQRFMDARSGKIIYVGAVCDTCIVVKPGPLTAGELPIEGRIYTPAEFKKYCRPYSMARNVA